MKQKAVDGTHTAGKWLYAHKTIVESGCGAMWRCAATEGESGGSGGSGGRAEPTLCALCTINTNCVHAHKKRCACTLGSTCTINQKSTRTVHTINAVLSNSVCAKKAADQQRPHDLSTSCAATILRTTSRPCVQYAHHEQFLAHQPHCAVCKVWTLSVYLSGKCIVPGTLYAGNLTLCMHVVGSFHRAQQSDGAHLGFRKTMHIVL